MQEFISYLSDTIGSLVENLALRFEGESGVHGQNEEVGSHGDSKAGVVVVIVVGLFHLCSAIFALLVVEAEFLVKFLEQFTEGTGIQEIVSNK